MGGRYLKYIGMETQVWNKKKKTVDGKSESGWVKRGIRLVFVKSIQAIAIQMHSWPIDENGVDSLPTRSLV